MKKYKLAASLMACMIAAAQFSAPDVMAGVDYSDTIDSVTVKNYFVTKKGVTAPIVSFKYTLSPGAKIDGTDTTHAIEPGPSGAVFASSGSSTMSVSYSPDDAMTAEANAPSGSTIGFATPDNTSDETYVEKDITVDLSGVTFPAAGIYRYVITQNVTTATGITYDSDVKRYLDIFVHKSDKTEEDTYDAGTAIIRLNSGAPDVEGKADAAIKSTGFTNRYDANNLAFSKQVTGNQASSNQYFKFTVKLTGGLSTVSGDTPVSLNGSVFDAKPSESMATIYDADVMAKANSIETTTAEGETEYTKLSSLTLSQLMAGKEFYLKAGQSISLSGIPAGMGYTVTEAEEDYTPSVTVTGDEDCENSDSKVNDSLLTQNTNLAFLNTRSGLIPSTGVTAAFAVPAAAMLAGVAGIALLVLKRLRSAAKKA